MHHKCVWGFSNVAIEARWIINDAKIFINFLFHTTLQVKQIITHENFTNDNGKIENDLALLLLENDVVFNDVIQPAIIGNDTDELDKSYVSHIFIHSKRTY